ncbi:MAG: beta-galactosidase, partial [Dehalococcoidia bacterium]|nr:beta-galactosidase [Dehalococcoidia bacterium]
MTRPGRWLVAIVLVGPLLLASVAGAVAQQAATTMPPLRYAVHTTRVHDAPMRLVAEAGFDTIVQLLAWREIEPTRGEFYWEYPDAILRAAAYYNLAVVLRLDHQPEWARPGRTNGPPTDLADYAAFVSRVAERYRGRVLGYIIWN